ncbi:MAG: histidine phosphatase family protein [Pseudomonadota bacterium]
MKYLTILRHGKSSWANPGLADRDRPLNARGEGQMPALAHWFEQGLAGASVPTPDVVLCSPAMRTQQTLEGFVSALPKARVTVVEQLYSGTMDDYWDAICGEGGDHIVVVAHNPHCDELARYLTAPSSPAADHLMERHFGTANLALFSFAMDDWTGLTRGSGQLQVFLRPSDMMAKV